MSERANLSRSPSGGRGFSYEVIARRYRPRFFEEVVGQEAVSEALQQAIVQERLGHAYLFCGPRGVGKTSMARIFARALQCPEAKAGVPCDSCSTCERIFRGEDADVLELDGASHRGIDDIRELVQHVKYAPSSGPYRIFIIDEVHMLTREAFNSLLKTLEEPPAHVKFVFATTEPEKVLPTVMSRCQRCDFASIAPSDIVKRLAQICELEGASPEDGVLVRIADLARGGMRDSQSLLDQLLSFSGEGPTLEDLDRITGRISQARLRELVGVAEEGRTGELIPLLGEVLSRGTDPSVLLEQVVEYLREQLHQGVGSDWGDVEIERNLLAQEILQEARQRMRRIDRADIVLELALMRIGTLSDLVPLAELRRSLASAGGGAEGTLPSGGPGAPRRSAAVPSRSEETQRPVSVEKPAGSSSAPRVETPGARLRRGFEEKAEARVVVGKPATVVPGEDSADPKARLFEEVSGYSPIVARRLRQECQLLEEGGKLRLSLSPAAHKILTTEGQFALGRWKKSCQQEVEVIVDSRLSTESVETVSIASDEDSEPPEIVSRAAEIFRGDLIDGGQRSPRRQKATEARPEVLEGERE
ncbi:MAG TPA: DNA polymerase III subunit gamma/tau [Planctomycetes bacterium]|nr:DNA polymerase III subunit gamma/tau [Planctomycetota bacterium]HIN80589.1 DNA polymerase III subunit gamma/tau [Planctomycetota bacterium]